MARSSPDRTFRSGFRPLGFAAPKRGAEPSARAQCAHFGQNVGDAPFRSCYSPPRVAEKDESAEVQERFSSGLGLVDIIARQILRTLGGAAELDELLSFGREGLWDAARRFDASRGVPFRGYANFRVRGAIIDGVRTSARLSRRTHERLNGLQAASRVSEGAHEDLAAPRAPGAGPAEAEQALGDHLAAM